MAYETSPEQVRVSYVIITRNRRSELKKCVKNVESQRYPSSEIVVVDNNSMDDTCELIREEFPEVRLIELGYNAGVAGGRNAGMKAARGDVVICIDDDAVFTNEETTDRVVQHFEDNEKLGIIAFRVLDAGTGDLQRSAIPRRDKKEPGHLSLVSYYCGAGHAIRRAMLDQTGLYPERYFRGGQEIALSFQVLDEGWEILYDRECEVLHKESRTARRRGQRTYYYTRSRIWLPIQYLPWRYALVQAGLWFAKLSVEAVKRWECKYFIRGLWDMARGLPEVLRDRSPLCHEAIKKLKQTSGRTWW